MVALAARTRNSGALWLLLRSFGRTRRFHFTRRFHVHALSALDSERAGAQRQADDALMRQRMWHTAAVDRRRAGVK